MSEYERSDEESILYATTFGELASGDELFANNLRIEARRVYYVGASRGVYAVKEIAVALFLMALVGLLGIGVIKHVENRTGHNESASFTADPASSRLGA